MRQVFGKKSEKRINVSAPLPMEQLWLGGEAPEQTQVAEATTIKEHVRKRCGNARGQVSAAIVLWNSVYLEQVTSFLREHRKNVPDELREHLSPLRWEHINLTGDYSLGK